MSSRMNDVTTPPIMEAMIPTRTAPPSLYHSREMKEALAGGRVEALSRHPAPE